MYTSMNRIVSFILLIIFFENAFSQENSIYNNDYLDPFIINPACTGAENYPVAHLSVKKQWLGFSGSPSTYLLSGNYRIGEYDFYDPKGFVNKGPLQLKDRIGLGASIFKDNNGPLENTGGLISYAYHLPLKNNSKFSLGMSVIMAHYALNSSILKPNEINDSYLLTGNANIFRANLGFGVFYYNNTYFAGVSVNKFLPGISNVNESIKELPSYFVMGGYKFWKNNYAFNIEPSITLKKLRNENLIIDTHAKLYVKRLNWIAFSYSSSQKLNFQFGLKLYKMLYVGYDYEQNISNIASYNYGTHEISLGINLGLISIEGVRETVKN